MNALIDCIRHGLPLESDFPIAERPSDPDLRDGVNVWFFEENGEFGVPRLGLDAVADSWDHRNDWDNRRFCANVVFPSGRVLGGWYDSPAVSNIDTRGESRILGTEAVRFHCIEPFYRWHVSFDQELTDTDTAAQVAGRVDPAKTARVRIEADITLQIPVWSQVFAEDDERPVAGWMGRGWRYETPVKVDGMFEIDGKKRDFKATGSLVRRKSKRTSAAGMYGHCWLAAGFPDGRAFGCNVFPKLAGRPEYNTGYLYKDGRFYDAKVVEAPWLRGMLFAGEDMSVTLESELGLTRIEGESLLSTFKPGNPRMGGLTLNQGGVRFTWDGQVAIGLTERSAIFATPGVT